MGLSTRDQLKWWGVVALVLIIALWQISGALLPFVAGAAIAYFLDPVADRMESMGLSRVWATVIISIITLLAFVLIAVVVVPLMIDQIRGLFESAPEYIAQLQAYLTEKFPSLFEEDSMLRKTLASFQGVLKDKGLAFVNGILSGSLALIDFVLIVVVTPVVAFYLLLDWDRMVRTIDKWLPREHADTVRSLARRVDRVLSGFVRGQLSVCAILGSFYAISLILIGLKFGLIVGLIAGLISFIPFVGSIVGGVLSMGLALFQFWDNPIWIAAVAAVFLIGQAVEGNVLTPKLVGGSVGLHPVWLMFSLSAFGTMFGFVGLLIAVPVAASIGVLGRFAMEKYMGGALYKGPKGREPDTIEEE